MGKEKAGFLTPKAISNRIKSKGLQKLRWYCQMCQKQCRDENGFKCHTMSESHQRQLLLFAETPHKYMGGFSKEFKDDFLHLLSHRFGTKRVAANVVYQEYISHKEHIHMNATKWVTLTGFVKYLGRESICKVDQTEKGWFIAYIDRSPAAMARQEAAEKKERMQLDDEESNAKFLERQIERAKTTSKDTGPEFTELQRSDENERLSFSLGAAVTEKKADSSISSINNPLDKFVKPKLDASKKTKSDVEPKKHSAASAVKRKTALDEIMHMEEQKREKMQRKDFWLHPGIVVKVKTKTFGEKYYKKKALIREVQDQYVAVVKMIVSGEKLKIDQEYLETVIPAIGKPVLVVNGAYRGSEATLLSLQEAEFSCKIRIVTGTTKGRIVEGIQYEDICKLFIAT